MLQSFLDSAISLPVLVLKFHPADAMQAVLRALRSLGDIAAIGFGAAPIRAEPFAFVLACNRSEIQAILAAQLDATDPDLEGLGRATADHGLPWSELFPETITLAQKVGAMADIYASPMIGVASILGQLHELYKAHAALRSDIDRDVSLMGRVRSPSFLRATDEQVLLIYHTLRVVYRQQQLAGMQGRDPFHSALKRVDRCVTHYSNDRRHQPALDTRGHECA